MIGDIICKDRLGILQDFLSAALLHHVCIVHLDLDLLIAIQEALIRVRILPCPVLLITMVYKFLLRLIKLGVNARHGLPLSIGETFSFVILRGGFFVLDLLAGVMIDVAGLRTDGVFVREMRNALAVVYRGCVDFNHLFDLVLRHLATSEYLVWLSLWDA